MKIDIQVGQPAICGIPMGDPIMTFFLGESFLHVRLEDLKNYINIIWDSQGNRDKKVLEARDRLQQFFSELIFIAIREEKIEATNFKE